MPGLSMFSLDGRRALVTGAGRGLGAAMAGGLAAAGAQVALVARSEAELSQTAKRIAGSTAVIATDVSNIDALGDLVDRAEAELGGPLDIVLHAAGLQHREFAENFERDDWDRVLELNLSAPFFLSQEIGRRQLAAGRAGSHIFVGSLASQLSIRSTVAYTASKAGIYGVLRNLSLEWSEHNVRANGIGPGYVRTELTKALVDDQIRGPKVLDRIPMRRLGQPSEMVGAAVFLASEASSYVTGQLLMVDGGWSAS